VGPYPVFGMIVLFVGIIVFLDVFGDLMCVFMPFCLLRLCYKVKKRPRKASSYNANRLGRMICIVRYR
jgi:hypothetical protein